MRASACAFIRVGHEPEFPALPAVKAREALNSPPLCTFLYHARAHTKGCTHSWRMGSHNGGCDPFRPPGTLSPRGRGLLTVRPLAFIAQPPRWCHPCGVLQHHPHGRRSSSRNAIGFLEVPFPCAPYCRARDQAIDRAPRPDFGVFSRSSALNRPVPATASPRNCHARLGAPPLFPCARTGC